MKLQAQQRQSGGQELSQVAQLKVWAKQVSVEVETLIIRWRLAKISSNLPQNQKNPSADKMERMYDDLLELSRLDYYDAKVRMKALRMIMMQIGSRETSQLVSCIAKWPASEISIFLSEMMSCMLIFWQQTSIHALKSQLDLIAVFCSSQSTTESHEVIPFIDFISQLARVNHTSCQAIVDAKFLDVLAEVHRHCSFETTPEVVTSCKSALDVLLEYPHGLYDILNLRRMDLVWPRRSDLIPLSEHSLLLAEYTPRARQEVLQTLSKSLLWDRLCEIEVIISVPVYFVDNPGTEKDLFDVCIDLLHLSLNHDDADIARDSYDLLLYSIALGDGWWTALRNVLILLPYNANLDFFYRLIYPLLRLKTEVLPTATKFYKYVKARHPDVNPAEHFVQFAIYVAERSSDSALALKNADIISLLSAMRQNNHGISDYLGRLLALFQQLSDAEQAETISRQQNTNATKTRDRSASNVTLK